MSFLQPEIKAKQPRSQATPLSEDVLDVLRKQVLGGAFGEGLGPLQREAGTATRQFIKSRQTMDDFGKLAQPLIDISRRETDRSAADLRESFGIAGSRFGTPLAFGESRLRTDAGQNLDATLAELFQQEQGRLLEAIGMLQSIGQQNIEPIMNMAQLGVLPEEMFAVDSPWMLAIEGIAALAEGAGTAASGFQT